VIRRYVISDSSNLVKLIESEGDLWSSYYLGDGRIRYLESIQQSITYVIIIKEELIGYIRAIDDSGFDVYICDLLVKKEKRGNHYGIKLVESIKTHFPNRDIYVMSDVDDYYFKAGFKRVGSIFKI